MDPRFPDGTLPPLLGSHKSFTQIVDQPAAGADWSFMPSGSDWARLLSIVGTLTTNADTAQRAVDITVTDQDGNLITRDAAVDGQAESTTVIYSHRPGSMFYAPPSPLPTSTGSLPGFWLPPGATVAAATANLDAGNPATQASSNNGGDTAIVPCTIVAGVSDEFVWTGGGGGGAPTTFTIAPGVYATFAALQAAWNAALAGAVVFASQAHVTIDPGTGETVITAVADIGTAGDNDTAAVGANDAFIVIFGFPETFTLAGGVDPELGDQWSNVVATYVVAYHRYWETLEAMLDQQNAAH